MSACLIAPIVEGHGEVEAVPILLRRLHKEQGRPGQLHVNPPIRVKLGSFLDDQLYFRRYVELATRKALDRRPSAVLILLDSEDACPGELGPELLRRAQEVHSGMSFLVVLAHREYETWFLAASSSLGGIAGLPADLEPPSDAEAIRGAKEWLGVRMPRGYDPLNHQAVFTQHFSLAQASSVPSFARFQRRLKQVFTAV